MKQINDPVFGELVYDESKKAWTKKINLGIWFGDDYLLDLVVKCGKEEEIVDFQREAFLSYLADLQNIKREFRETLLSYFKNHYEMFNRSWALPEKLKIDVVDSKATLGFFNPKQLFLDRKGNYGWLSNFISEQYLITVVLSDGKPRIFKGWNLLEDYAVIDDDVFGEMYFDLGWKKEIKTNLNGVEGEWVLLQAAAFKGKNITPEQKSCYQKYLQKEQEFIEEYPKALLEYYEYNYEMIEEIWDDADFYKPESVDLDDIKDLIQFQRLYFNRDGVRYGWLCKCAWDSVYGLALYYDENQDGICIGIKDDLLI
ncbi:MAG: hypothetical protein MJY63_02215 [Paludibacteraceae bacterium]|nr:hypothetical protein [Paludibacteraceae bacterium]